MDGTPKTAMMAGAAGGYLLGRTKKGKLALVLGLLFLARRLGISPQELVRKGVEQVSEMPEFAKLSDQVREELMTAARTAVTTIVNRRIDGLSDTLRARTEELAGADGGEEQKSTGEEEAGERGEDEKSQEAASKEPEAEPDSERQRANGREPSRRATATRR